MKKIVATVILGFTCWYGLLKFFHLSDINDFRNLLYQAKYGKSIKVANNTSFVNANDIKDSLPLEKATWWWYLNRNDLQRSLEQQPLIKKATVETCKGWGCFKFSILERTPKLIVQVGKIWWLVSEDGYFLTPVPKDFFSNSNATNNEIPLPLAKLPRVENLLGSEEVAAPHLKLANHHPAPDIVKKRIKQLLNQIQLIQKVLGFNINRVVVRALGDYVVYFQELPFSVIFGGEALTEISDSQNSNQPSNPVDVHEIINEQLRRLKILLPQIKKETRKVKEVDLGFRKVAVVRFISS